ncbi:MAG: preprotein translocase subunit SecE [Desulfobacteraceae bacterium]|nr:preprotein translocase subunit SecE [Desulfobacteraceae bacterium]
MNPIAKIRNVYHETVAELAKCTWPGWNELGESTVLVIVSVLILSLFVFFADWILQAIIQLLTVTL